MVHGKHVVGLANKSLSYIYELGFVFLCYIIQCFSLNYYLVKYLFIIIKYI